MKTKLLRKVRKYMKGKGIVEYNYDYNYTGDIKEYHLYCIEEMHPIYKTSYFNTMISFLIGKAVGVKKRGQLQEEKIKRIAKRKALKEREKLNWIIKG